MANILLVDDDSATLRVLSRVLATEGHQVAVAATHDDALGCLTDGRTFDLFILDFWIGSHTGLDLMVALKRAQPQTPVLFLSGGSEAVSLETSTALAEMHGAVEFLYKPIEASELFRAVRRHVA